MKFILHLFLAVLAITTAGCTHNDGDIGPLFGSWLVEDMTLDGQRLEPGTDHGYLQFQGAVVMCKLIDDRHSLLFYSVGSYERVDDALLLNFTHSDNNSEPGQLQYSAPEWLMLTPNAVNRMEIIALNNKEMKLKHITPDGSIVEYSFKKTH